MCRAPVPPCPACGLPRMKRRELVLRNSICTQRAGRAGGLSRAFPVRPRVQGSAASAPGARAGARGGVAAAGDWAAVVQVHGEPARGGAAAGAVCDHRAGLQGEDRAARRGAAADHHAGAPGRAAQGDGRVCAGAPGAEPGQPGRHRAGALMQNRPRSCTAGSVVRPGVHHAGRFHVSAHVALMRLRVRCS